MNVYIYGILGMLILPLYSIKKGPWNKIKSFLQASIFLYPRPISSIIFITWYEESGRALSQSKAFLLFMLNIKINITASIKAL